MFQGPIFSFSAKGTYNGITVISKSAGPASPPSVNFEGPHAILRAIGPRASFILTPGYNRSLMFQTFRLVKYFRIWKQKVPSKSCNNPTFQYEYNWPSISICQIHPLFHYHNVLCIFNLGAVIKWSINNPICSRLVKSIYH